MIGLTDEQLKIVMTAAGAIAPEKRSMFLERVGAMLKVRHRFTDTTLTKFQNWQRAVWSRSTPMPRERPTMKMLRAALPSVTRSRAAASLICRSVVLAQPIRVLW